MADNDTHDRDRPQTGDEADERWVPSLSDAVQERLFEGVKATDRAARKEGGSCDPRIYLSFTVKHGGESARVEWLRTSRYLEWRLRSTRLRSRIQCPPGTLLAAWAGFLLTKEAYRRYVYPVIADMQHEYCEALAAGEEWHARWIAVRGWLLVVPGWLVGIAGRVVKRLFSA